MFCEKCGSKMSDDAVFCPKCGNRRIEIEETEIVVEPKNVDKKQDQEEAGTEIVDRNDESQKSKKNNSHKLLKYLLAAVAVVVFGYILYSLVDAFFVVNGYKDKLLRPESLNVRDAYTFDGTFYNDDSDPSVEKYFPNEKHFVLMHCTLKNAGGTVTEDYILYDRDTGNYYSSKEIPRSVGYGRPWTELSYAESFYYSAVWSEFDTNVSKWKKDFKYRRNIWYKIF